MGQFILKPTGLIRERHSATSLFTLLISPSNFFSISEDIVNWIIDIKSVGSTYLDLQMKCLITLAKCRIHIFDLNLK